MPGLQNLRTWVQLQWHISAISAISEGRTDTLVALSNDYNASNHIELSFIVEFMLILFVYMNIKVAIELLSQRNPIEQTM